MRTLFIFLACCWALHVQAQHPYSLTVTVSGIPENSQFYLEDISTDQTRLLDSTIVRNGQLIFQGQLAQPVVRTILRSKDMSNYRIFWMQAADVMMKAAAGKFRQAEISGSATEDQQTVLTGMIKKTGDEKKASMDFIRQFPGSPVSASVLSIYASTWGKQTTQELYDLLTPEMKRSGYGIKTSQFLEFNREIRIGGAFADFTLPDADGNPVSLSGFKGKTVLLEFWGSWCGPCRAGHPKLVATYNQYKDKGFEILGVAAEKSREDFLQAIKADKLPWTNLSDFKGDQNQAALIYGVSYYPTNFLINKDGIIVARDLRGEALSKKLKEVLEK